MTPQEYDAISAVRTDVSHARSEIADGLKEIRDLMESRRLEEVEVHRSIDFRLRKVEQVAHTTRVLAYGALVFATACVGGALYLVH